jgi:hypothetical protein
MNDPTEQARRELVAEINTEAAERKALEARYGRVWTTQELAADFEVVGFLAPFVVVTRKADSVRGSLMFQHSPRLYFSFTEDR